MSFAAGASKTQNIRMGTCAVLYGDAGSEVDLGFTVGGVDLTLDTSTKTIMVDQFGETPVDERIMGRSLMVKCPMAETSIELIKNVMPGVDVIGTNERVEIKSGTGISLLASAKSLILRPIDLHEISDKSEDFRVPLAAAPGALQFAYKYDDQRVFNLEFKGYPDSATGVIAMYGDPDAV